MLQQTVFSRGLWGSGETAGREAGDQGHPAVGGCASASRTWPGFLDATVCTGLPAGKSSARAHPALCRASLVSHPGSGLATSSEARPPPPLCRLLFPSIQSRRESASACALSADCIPGQQELLHAARDSRGVPACHLVPVSGHAGLQHVAARCPMAGVVLHSPFSLAVPWVRGTGIFLLSHICSSVFSGAQQPGLPYYTDPGGPGLNPAGNPMAMAFQVQPNSPQGSTAYPPPPSYCNTPPPPYEQVVKSK